MLGTRLPAGSQGCGQALCILCRCAVIRLGFLDPGKQAFGVTGVTQLQPRHHTVVRDISFKRSLQKKVLSGNNFLEAYYDNTLYLSIFYYLF